MHVSLAPSRLRVEPDQKMATPFLVKGGGRVILGGSEGPDGMAQPIVPAPDSMFGPRGACIPDSNGPLFACDTGHHRLLIWRQVPITDHTPADLLIGQPDFTREGRNAKGEISAATLNVPTGVSAANGVLAVADAWNHRVLLWHGYPDTNNRPADVVLGQVDFTSGLANRGGDTARADSLNWCYGVAIIDNHLLIADTGNRRVMVWNEIPQRNGVAADVVLGQPNFTTRDENAGEDAGGLGMRWPHGITVVDPMLLVADAGNNRVMVWRNWPKANGLPCDFVLGQPDLAGRDHNRAAYYPTAGAMSMPYGITVLGKRLIVADTANSRLLGFETDTLAMGGTASGFAAQLDFTAKGDNRWGNAERDSLCWPYSVASCNTTVVIADSGNNRVLLWDAVP